MGRRFLFGLAALLAVGGCPGKQRTMLVVEIDSNLAVPDELDKVDVAITANGTTPVTPYSLITDYKLPLHVGVVETGDGAGNVTIVASGYKGPTFVVSETAIVGFVEGKSMLLKLFLARECIGKTCPTAGQTCTSGGTCRDPVRNSNDLTPFTPSDLTDAASVHTDANPSERAQFADAATASHEDAIGSGGSAGQTDANISTSDGGGSVGLDLQPTQHDAGAELGASPVQDAEAGRGLDLGAVKDAPSVWMPDGAADLSSDTLPGYVPDAARDVAADFPSGPCWSAAGPAAPGIVCRKAVGPCDVDEVCDGISAACPPDKYAPTTTVCRQAAGLCDIAESCTGTSPLCPADVVLTLGTLCRPAAGACDLAESCSGASPDCPADGMAPPGTTCRASTDGSHCDPAETCTGSSVACPVDVIYVLPAAPTNVAALAGTQQATISWDLVAGATGYNVKQSPISGSGYATQGQPPTTTAPPYVNTGLTGDTIYYYVVSSVNTISTCESGNSLETFVKPTGPCIPPSAPTLTASASNGQVLLTWTPSIGATSYSVTRSTTTGTGYLFQATVITGTSYTDPNVSGGTTYYYVVTASNGACSSVYSNEVAASSTCTPPAAPTNLTAVANNGSVALTWTAPQGAVSYRISRSTTSGSGYGLVAISSTASFTDATVVNGTTYYYVVTASNGTCNSGNSAEVPATPKCTPPSVPTNVLATAGDGQIALAWTASTAGAISYQVLRSTKAGGPYTPVATLTSTGFMDTNVSNGVIYYYVVSASNGSCSSASSAEASATPVCTPPSVPTNLLATPGDNQVALSWTAPTTGNVVSYTVSRSTVSGGAYSSIANPTGTSYADSTASNGTTYYYVVSASNGTCNSPNSTEVFAMPVATCAQAAPTGVSATAGNRQVTLSWTAAAGATSYGIGRSTISGAGYSSAGTTSATTFVDTDPALVNGTTYYYVVTANGACASPNSTEVSATPVCTPPIVPTGVTASANSSNGNITVSWNAVNAATGYTVSRATSASGPFTAVSTNQTAASFTDLGTGLTAGMTYYYVVSASNASGTCMSGNSTPAAGPAVSCSSPSVPSNVQATAGIGRVTVSWTASTGGPTSYTVSRRTGTTGAFGVIKTAVTTTSYVDSNVTDGTTYYYEVSAQNAGGVCSSANSGGSSAATPRDCRVVSGTTPLAPAPSPGHTGKFGTTGAICFVTCDSITGGWACYGTDGRTITINGSPVGCASMPIPAAKTLGYNVIDITAGPHDYAEIWWWGTYYTGTCTIPAAGLDF